MATSFVEDLWSSVFTPGPTPTLLVATNASFAALQLLLFVLLVATSSIHFVVLSFLCGALWWSINWFAREVREIRAGEEEEQQKAKLADKDIRKDGGIDYTDSETETEGVSTNRRRKEPAASSSHATRSTTASALTLQAEPEDEALRKRRSLGGDSSGYGSTDSEWEKVDEDKPA